ncbi:transcriptional regulator [Paraclostridium benzoelyticum]|uniref:Transcriptional regulator n=1 Tax=Paraclostridium benzoelyticum TaxID=1629550 RepID=A0A0M3DIA2_9FIRM|nr:helix-turn-helix transcriptional regulator [Paraclostridium benzoelyticum]KKY01117.1 transcriptional regulator [Paraclostridium benzoelyticum]OXX83935.1 transcriptional regulator [Paraclostridium benzoelyticum]
MKISEVIRHYRKKENLTQEQVANYLNISAPAVNKWEKETSYPDITLLAPLARVLKIDINTLLSFNEDLTDVEVENFVEEVVQISEKYGYEKAFEKGCNLIKQYPSCDELIYWVSLALRIELLVSKIEGKDKYEKNIIDWLQLVAASSKEKIASMAKLLLSVIYKEKKEYGKAQEILDKIPDIEVDKTFQQASLFKSSGKIDDAYAVCEGMLLKNAHDTLNVLIFIISMLCEENKFSEAEEYLESVKKHVEAFDLGTYHKYPLELLLAKEKQDKERIIESIVNMVNEAGSMDDSLKSKLYKHRNTNEDNEKSEDWYRSLVVELIKKDNTLDFVKNDSRIKFLLN